MYNAYNACPCPYFMDMTKHRPKTMYNAYPCPYFTNMQMYSPSYMNNQYDPGCMNQYMPYTDGMRYDLMSNAMPYSQKQPPIELQDFGPYPYVVNINEAAKQNNTFRTALWTGKHLQVTLMSINVGDDIGLEIHPNVDQFIRVEDGQGLVRMGKNKDRLDFQANVSDEFAIMIPSGTWHNVINTGNIPLKVYSIYAPPQHPHGTIHETKADAEAEARE
ncbi:cupin domain-containing protein [Clostridium sp. JN-9]|nr:cupin domain-containing protein [Clostridium sp. JN-9]